MILSLLRRPKRPTISSLYGMIVAQARLPIFYREYGVPDTVNGRFDLLVAHLSLVLSRLNAEGGAEYNPAAQALFDVFCLDMDENLREIGIGDLKVPKEMAKIGEAFYGRARSYDAALASPDDAALVAALARNVLGTTDDAAPGARRLAAYVRAASASLHRQSREDLLGGGAISFPDPAGV